MKRLLFVPVAVLAVWLYLRHQHSPADHRLKIARQWVDRGLFLWKGGQKRIEKNIELLFPEIGPDETEEIAREVAHTVGANFAYALGSWHETVNDVRHRIEIGSGLIELQERIAAGEKAVVVVDHVAPFDGAAAIVEILGVEAGIVVEKLPGPLAAFFKRSRSSWKGIRLITAERGSTYMKAKEFLDEHNLAVVFIDIFRSVGKSDVAVSLGQLQVGVASLPVRLAFESGATLYTMLPVWKNNGVICLDAVPLEMTHTGELEIDIKRETVQLMDERVSPHISCNIRHWMRAFSDDFSKFA